jgi:hypothetical protein
MTGIETIFKSNELPRWQPNCVRILPRICQRVFSFERIPVRHHKPNVVYVQTGGFNLSSRLYFHRRGNNFSLSGERAGRRSFHHLSFALRDHEGPWCIAICRRFFEPFAHPTYARRVPLDSLWQPFGWSVTQLNAVVTHARQNLTDFVTQKNPMFNAD